MKRPAGDTARAATSDELNDLSRKSRSTRAEPLVCVGWPTQAARKKPASESGGLKWAQSFLTKGLAAERSQRHRGKMTWTLALAGPPTKCRAEPLVCVSGGRLPDMKTKRDSVRPSGLPSCDARHTHRHDSTKVSPIWASHAIQVGGFLPSD
jgi:hypothetical protein